MSANTPRSLFTTQNREARGVGGYAPTFSLAPDLIIGSTISNANTLSAAVDTNFFAFCAGSTVILAAVNARLGLDQRFFNAKPDASPSQITPSYYNPGTPTRASASRSYITSLPRDEVASGGVASGERSVDSSSRVKSAHRSRTLTCVAISPSGRLIAVGEVGFRPRVLIFSTASDARTDTPLACLTEHTFGVKALAFSRDSRWLCSLGDLHDGGFFLWSINTKTGALRLDSSNRCTTADAIAWMGTSVVSIGTRHVKIWRLEQPTSASKVRRGLDNVNDGLPASPAPKTFAGRNCLLGPLKDATFTSVAAISDDRAVLGTQEGVVCLLDDANRAQRLYQVGQTDYFITCITVDRSSGTVWLGGNGLEAEALPLDALLTMEDQLASAQEQNGVGTRIDRKKENWPRIMAICCVDHQIVAVDSNRTLRIYDVESTSSDPSDVPKTRTVLQLPAPASPILGVVVLSKPNKTRSDFLTYSKNGDIFHWLWNGSCSSQILVRLDHPLALGSQGCNELRVVREASLNSVLLAGDKAGLVHLLDTGGEVQTVAKVHDGEVYDLAVHELAGNESLVASCGRDKIIQIFRLADNDLPLQQSLINEHGGPIRRLEFADNGSVLTSMSPDRTIVIHQKVRRPDSSVAFVSTKVINLQATPLAMSLLPAAASNLLVSATDRCIRKISFIEGRVTHTIKMADQLNGEACVTSRLAVGDLGQQILNPNVIAGFSSTDRSIRLYNAETGSLLAMEFGQPAVSDLAFGKAPKLNGEVVNKIISTGADGTIVIWSILTRSQSNDFKHDMLRDNDASRIRPPAVPSPLRRVLSKAEIAQYQKSLDNQKGDTPHSSMNLSPSLPGRKTWNYAVSSSSEIIDRGLPKTIYSPHASADVCFHGSQIKHASPDRCPKISLQSQSRRSSSDEPQRDISVHRERDINTTAEQLLSIAQNFRRQLKVSKNNLSMDTAQTLRVELYSTLRSLTQETSRSGPHGEEIVTNHSTISLREWLITG
ncbi:MAG: hypothetical protein Q9206_003438 [Seirophora lacunosa]